MAFEDSVYKYLKFYKQAPEGVKRFLAVFYKLLPNTMRYGRHYKHFRNLVRESKKWDKDEIEAYQLQQVNSLLEVSKRCVPFYKKQLKSIKLPFKSLEDFSKAVPLVTKEEVRNHYEDFVNPGIPASKTLISSTGGTTGEPLKIRYEKGISRTKELVFMNDQWGRVGFKNNDLRIVFRSSLIRDKRNDRPWEFDPIKNRYFFSSFDLSGEVIDKYIKKMEEIRPEYLHVYPSVLTIIASYMKKKGIRFNFIKAVFSGSENTYPGQNKLFREVFNARVFRWYGLAEASALAGACEYKDWYHCYPAYSYAELVDAEGKPVRDPDARGEIVGTTFHNYAMPLIRYRTGDFAFYGGDRCPECKRIGLLFKEVEGRAQEVIYDMTGNKYSLGPFIFGIHEEWWSNVSAVQFEQFERGKLILRAVSNRLDSRELEEYLKKTFIPRFSNNFEIDIMPVGHIERSVTGKHRYLVQHIE